MMKVEIRQEQITIPVDPNAGARQGYRQQYLQIKLTEAQAEALYRLRRGASVAGVRLANGKEVTTTPSAVAWLLELIATRV